MEEKTALNNEAKYQQMESGGCQLTDPIFVNDLGMHGDGPRIQDVLDGTYEIPDVSTPETREFLEACKYVDGVDYVMCNPMVIELLGRECNQNSLKLDSHATKQFSRPGRSRMDQCISKRCTIDHHKSRRLCFAMTSCDQAGSYDRIVHNAAALALLDLINV